MKRSKIELRAAVRNIMQKDVGEKHYLIGINGHYARGGRTLNPEDACREAADSLAEHVAWQIESLEMAGFRVLLPGEVL